MMRVLAYGVQQTIDRMVHGGAKARAAFQEANVYEAEKIMTESQRQVPVDTGRLKNSKFINHVFDGDGVVSTLGYRAEYAVPVHEIGPDRVVHKNGKWKFLEDPVRQAMDGYRGRVNDHVRKALGR